MDDRLDRVRYIEITPEVARSTPRGPNRPLSKARWQRYAKLMKQGEWDPDADELYKFNEDGELVEGQHRYEGVADSGVTIWGLALFGVKPQSVALMGGGAARTLGEVLSMQGESNYNALAAAINVAFRWYVHGIDGIRVWSGSHGPSRQEALDFLGEHPEMREAVKNTKRYTKFFKGVVRPGLLAGLWMILAELDSDSCLDFFERLVNGTNLDETSPIYRLRERILDIKSNADHLGQRGISEYMIMAYFFKCWIAYMDGKPMGQLRFSSGGANPEKFPIPYRSEL